MMDENDAGKEGAEGPTSEGSEKGSEPTRESGPRAYLRKWIEPDGVTAFFTFVLAVFAIAAWRESIKGTEAMQGQLKTMLADREPLVEVIMPEVPGLDPNSSRIFWNVHYVNAGRSIAYDFRPQTFMRLLESPDAEFEPNGANVGPYVDIDNQSITATLMPQVPKFIEVWSRPGFSDMTFGMLNWVGAISVLVHVKYKTTPDSASKEQWFCYTKLGDGSITEPKLSDCLSALPRKYGGTKD